MERNGFETHTNVSFKGLSVTFSCSGLGQQTYICSFTWNLGPSQTRFNKICVLVEHREKEGQL